MAPTETAEITIVDTKDLGQNKCSVTVQCADQVGVTDLAARHMAQAEASKTLSRAGFSNQSGPYPVDADGVSSDAVNSGAVAVAAFRQDFTFQGGL
jgi:hypothetical protein